MNRYNQLNVFYFSGTGNAKRIALWLSEFALQNNIKTQIFDIAKVKKEQFSNNLNDSLLILISPIHGFNYPPIMLDFIFNFPKGKNKMVLMNTRAGMKIGSWITPGITGIAFFLASVVLKIKGYQIMGQIPFDMPSNWLSLHPALNQNAVKYLHKVNHERTQKHARKIFAGKKDFYANRDIIQDILVSPISIGYYFLGRFVFSKTFFASHLCNNCGLCMKNCPVNAIKSKNEHPYWSFHCESCMKCMNECPQRAIETAHGLFIATAFLSSSISTYLINISFPLEMNVYLEFVLFNLLFFTLLWLFYRLQHLLLLNKFWAKMITKIALTHCSFWGRYKSIPDDKWKQ